MGPGVPPQQCNTVAVPSATRVVWTCTFIERSEDAAAAQSCGTIGDSQVEVHVPDTTKPGLTDIWREYKDAKRVAASMLVALFFGCVVAVFGASEA